jgi:hypothetical protein
MTSNQSNYSNYYQENRKARLEYQHRYNREHYAEIKIKNRLRYHSKIRQELDKELERSRTKQ